MKLRVSPTIYVANFLSASVTTCRPNGSVDLAPIISGLGEPQAVAVSRGGTIYVLDDTAGAVLTFGSDGTPQPPTIPLPAGMRDTGVNDFGIDAGPDGTIIVPLSACIFDGSPSVLRFAPDGTPLGSSPRRRSWVDIISIDQTSVNRTAHGRRSRSLGRILRARLPSMPQARCI